MSRPTLAIGAIAIGFALNAVVPVPSLAQDWPTRPITLVVPAAAGGGSDVIGRVLSPHLSEILRQQVIIENIGGAGGMIGAQRVAKAASDGYRFVLGNLGSHAANQTLYKHPLYNATIDFAPVALIAEQPLVLIARKDLPADNLSEFIAYTKANQAKMQYGSAGAGSPTHLACALVNLAIGVNVMHVAYRGGGPAMQDLIAGRIDYQCPTAAAAVPLLEGKLAKAIAILTKNRSRVLPNLASAQEQGLNVFEVDDWYAFFLPTGTPTAIIRKLHEATVVTMDRPVAQERLSELGAEVVVPERRSPEYLQGFVEREIKKWAAGASVELLTFKKEPCMSANEVCRFRDLLSKGPAMGCESISVTPVTPRIGANVEGVTLSKSLSNRQIEELHQALAEHQVLFFRDQPLDVEAHKRLGRYFGELHIHPNTPGPEGHPEILPIHADANSKRINGEYWHSDVSCDEEPPMGSILYLHTVPPYGGDTLFASQYAAYDALSPRMKVYLEGLSATHSGDHVYRRNNARIARKETGKVYPKASHPVVRTHPVTKRKALYVNGNFTTHIDGLPRDEGRAILDFLCEFSTREEFQVRFRWQPHSVAFWDNRCVQHQAVWDYYPQIRSGRRVTIKGDRPF